MKPDPKAAHVASEWAHESPLIACRFDPQGRFVFATAEDSKIVRWDLASGAKTVVGAHQSWVYALAFSPDGQTLISGGGDDVLVWWPAAAEKPEPLRKLKAHEGWIRTLAVSPDGQLLASAGNDRVVRVWDAVDGSKLREFEGHERDVYSVVFHPGGRSLFSGDLRGW